MHSAILRQLAAEHIQEMIAAAGNARRAHQARRPRNSLRNRGAPTGQRDLQRDCGPVATAIPANSGPRHPDAQHRKSSSRRLLGIYHD